MIYLVVAMVLLLFLSVGYNIRQAGRIAEVKASSENLANATEAAQHSKEDEVSRLEVTLARYRKKLSEYEADLTTCQDPAIRRGMLKELGQILDVIPTKPKEKKDGQGKSG